jgi:hypothetical protein
MQLRRFQPQSTPLLPTYLKAQFLNPLLSVAPLFH